MGFFDDEDDESGCNAGYWSCGCCCSCWPDGPCQDEDDEEDSSSSE